MGNNLVPPRVWLKNENVPGLAMSRAFGDGVAVKAGVTSIPEIREFEPNEHDKFIVIGSDGVWEFISNEGVVEIIADFYEKGDIEGACEALMEEAVY